MPEAPKTHRSGKRWISKPGEKKSRQLMREVDQNGKSSSKNTGTGKLVPVMV